MNKDIDSKEIQNNSNEAPGLNAEADNETGEFQETESNDQVEKLKSELGETRDKFLRNYSEFENYKKRTQRERIELFKTANEDVILAVIPVLDDFERALKSFQNDSDSNSRQGGVALIYNKLKNILEQKGLKKMESIGTDFNVDHHEAITNMQVSDESMKGKVVDEAEPGYFLNGKVIRHAKVIVGI